VLLGTGVAYENSGRYGVRRREEGGGEERREMRWVVLNREWTCALNSLKMDMEGSDVVEVSQNQILCGFLHFKGESE
jgi:hypothetical protein